ncbi:NERD domain-containing protein [Arthrobacter bussei]|uniref:NERD domain-containing protein n=1 Tax=Arthrobacter bussei TaxID=2594179 RepID=A0A7X1TPX6_9MICC|nr:NERD domain-containing protein [Arthrobacter bussei]
MEAGQGAAEQARRAGERVSRLEAELEQARRTKQAWLAGAEGEQRVGDQLSRLEAEGWAVLHDVHWPGRPKANLDHILVGPGGVLVIDAKNWSGDVRLRDGDLRQNGFSRRREMEKALDQGAAVAALLEPQHRTLTQAWICLVGQPELLPSPTGGVTILGMDHLVEAVRTLPPVLEPALVGVIHDYLHGLLAGPTSPAVATTALLTRPDAVSSALADRRAAAAGSDSMPRPRNTAPARSPRPSRRARRRNQPSCLGAFGRLVLLAVALLIGTIVLQSFAETISTPPPVTPTIEQVVPAG